MNSVISDLKRQWSSAKSAQHRGKEIPFKLVCRFDTGTPDEELCVVADGTPLELLQFWREARAADLFVDAQYGQWGLRILSPTQSIRKTAKLRVDSSAELIEGDLVVGEFLGDSDLLLVRCDPAARDYGCVLVVLPIDKRKDWPTIAANFSQFISRFAESSGDKFWENAAI